MNELTIALLASGIVALILLVVVWRSTERVTTKLMFSALLLVPIFGPIAYVIILGLSGVPPQDERLQNRGYYGDYTQSWMSMKPHHEADLELRKRILAKRADPERAAQMSNSTDTEFKPAQGWIHVSNGTLPAIKSAIEQYADLQAAEYPGSFRAQLHPQSDGSVAVALPDGFPAYDLANMTGWLNSPPDHPDVYGAVAWITAPADGTNYYLEPETENPLGDTLVGASSAGHSVRVYLPDTKLTEDPTDRSYPKEHEIETSSNPTTIRVVLETSTAFGNPGFKLTEAE